MGFEAHDDSGERAWLACRRRYRVLWVGLVVLAVVLGVRFWSHREYVDEPFAVDRVVADSLDDQVNPNEASASSLARLPGIGLKKARAVVEYREQYRLEHGPDALPFMCPDDLTKVQGIGAATADRMEPYLRFGG